MSQETKQAQKRPVAGIKQIIAVASGKGGVGKSTTAVNLALALSSVGKRVGVLDADIYGPSIPVMLGGAGQEIQSTPDGQRMRPLERHGIWCHSLGYLVGEQEAAVWRGPMASRALMQLLHETAWPDLDILVVDMPPGTGDIQLTMAQQVPLSGAVVVTTPQDLALSDAIRGIEMFRKVSVTVLGIVENMSLHVCSHCGHSEPIFGHGGGEHVAKQYQVPLLGKLPLDLRIRQQADAGCPTVVAEPQSELAGNYLAIARDVLDALPPAPEPISFVNISS